MEMLKKIGVGVVSLGLAGSVAVGQSSEEERVTPVPDSAEAAAEKAKAAGDEVGDVRFIKPGEVEGDEDVRVTLAELAEEGPVVVIFYRGGWCPYCIRQIKEFDDARAQFEAAGATVVAIAGETPETVRKTIEKQEFEIGLLADPGHRAAREFGVVWSSSRHAKRLRETNGNDRGELNLGVTYVITKSEGVDSDGEAVFDIEWAFINEDYSKRARPRQVLYALNEL